MTNIKRLITAMTAMGILSSASLSAAEAGPLEIDHLGVIYLAFYTLKIKKA